jgi:hypothetical protein
MVIVMRAVLLRTAVLSGLLVTACMSVHAGGFEVLLQPGVSLVTKVQFVTADVGVCIALDGMYKTTNRGTTWRRCLELSNGEAYNLNCLDVSISASGIGLHVSGNRMFQTLDTGSTWTELEGTQKPTLNQSWTRFMRAYTGEHGFQQVITNDKLVASRDSLSGEWTYDTIPIRRSPQDAAFVNDTSAIILFEEGEVEFRTGPNRVRSFPNTPFGYRISADGPLVTIADIDKVWISRDGCETWSKAALRVTACSLAVVKDGCIMVVESDRVHYSSDSGHTWTAPIETRVKSVVAAQLMDCDTFFGFGFFDGEFLRSTSGIGPTVVSVQREAQMSSPRLTGIHAVRWEELEELLQCSDESVTIVGYNSLGEVLLEPTHIKECVRSLAGIRSRQSGQLIWLTKIAQKHTRTIVLLPLE